MNTIANFGDAKIVTTWHSKDTLGVWLREARFQFRGLVRTPAFVVPTLLFPAMFYLFFGVLFNRSGGIGEAVYVLATMGTFGIMAPALIGFGVGIAVERERGILALKRAFPLPPVAYFFGKIVMSAAFALLIFIILSVLAITLGGVRLAPHVWLVLAGVLVAGTLPFCALGLVVGLTVNGQGSTAIINLIYLPMSFLSGLWIPIQHMPHFLQHLAVVFPAYHLGQLALTAVGHGDGGNVLTHVVYLVAFSFVCLLVAARRWRHIQDR